MLHMLQLLERTIVRYACWHGWHGWSVGTRCSRYWASYRTIVKSEARHQLGSWVWSEQLFVFAGSGLEEHRTKEKKKQRHGSLGNSDTEQVRKSEPDSPTGQARACTPHRTHQVSALFCGCYAIMFYRLWVFMGLCGYFHAFLCNILKFL